MLSLRAILASLPWTLREVLQKLRRSFGGPRAVSLALYLRANVLDAPYLSSLIILKAADAAANQRNARLIRYNSARRSVQDADFPWRVYDSLFYREPMMTVASK